MDRRMCHNCTGNMYPDGDGWKCSACGVRVNAEGRHYFPKPNMTNADKIRAMSDKELAAFLAGKFTDHETKKAVQKGEMLTATYVSEMAHTWYAVWMQWLRQPAEESHG